MPDLLPADHPATDPSTPVWAARSLRVTGADPRLVPDTAAVRGHLRRFSRLFELVAVPGRYALALVMSADHGRLDCRLVLSAAGHDEATAEADADHLARTAAALVLAPPAVWAVEPCDTPPATRSTQGMRIRQHTVSVSDDTDTAQAVSRFEQAATTWTNLVDTVMGSGQLLTVRVALLPAAMTPDDQAWLARNHDAARRIAERAPHTLTGLRAARVAATLGDLTESLASPVAIADVTVSSDRPVPDPVVRTVAAAFTTETDVASASERADMASSAVAARLRYVGGYDTEPLDSGDLSWMAGTYLPAVGAIGARTVADLVSVTEASMLVRLPLPAAGPLPGVRARGGHRPLRGPTAEKGLAVGTAPDGAIVLLPIAEPVRHVHVTGRNGVGKSAFLDALCRAAIAAGHQVVFLDGHHDAAAALHAHTAKTHDAVLLDGDQAALCILPANPEGQAGDPQLVAAVRIILAALSGMWPADMTGPRWMQGAEALMHLMATLPGAHPLRQVADLVDGMYAETATTSGLHRYGRIIHRMTKSTSDDVIGWLTSKFDALSRTPITDLFAPVGEGRTASELLDDNDLVAVPLGGGVTETDARMASDLVLSTFGDALMSRRDRRPVLLVVDEAQRFSADYLERFATEGRKFGITAVYAHQHLSQLAPRTRDALIDNCPVRVTFRTSTDGNTLAAELGVSPAHHRALPDLTALARWPGPDGDTTTTLTVAPPQPAPPRPPASARPPDTDLAALLALRVAGQDAA